MTASKIAAVSAACIALMTLASCANTIKGIAKDTANTVDATKQAGHTVNKAAQ